MLNFESGNFKFFAVIKESIRTNLLLTLPVPKFTETSGKLWVSVPFSALKSPASRILCKLGIESIKFWRFS